MCYLYLPKPIANENKFALAQTRVPSLNISGEQTHASMTTAGSAKSTNGKTCFLNPIIITLRNSSVTAERGNGRCTPLSFPEGSGVAAVRGHEIAPSGAFLSQRHGTPPTAMGVRQRE
ncbi:hypothetical protein Zmor_013450 [Zophobas morio]|uniref:Uncharacterized protein n=1 Tax=Zophobas morio TaxID=2755281 RepID=A0AA38IHM0_9CUCU|nr:hypothetical protein Zmor_013450 [Zophobas morio]